MPDGRTGAAGLPLGAQTPGFPVLSSVECAAGRSSGLAKVGVVSGELVTGCHVLVLTHSGEVPLHDLQQFLVGLLPVVFLTTLDDSEIDMYSA